MYVDNNILIEILTKLDKIESSLNFFNNTFVITLGILASIFVIYLMYKLVDNFISF